MWQLGLGIIAGAAIAYWYLLRKRTRMVLHKNPESRADNPPAPEVPIHHALTSGAETDSAIVVRDQHPEQSLQTSAEPERVFLSPQEGPSEIKLVEGQAPETSDALLLSEGEDKQTALAKQTKALPPPSGEKSPIVKQSISGTLERAREDERRFLAPGAGPSEIVKAEVLPREPASQRFETPKRLRETEETPRLLEEREGNAPIVHVDEVPKPMVRGTPQREPQPVSEQAEPFAGDFREDDSAVRGEMVVVPTQSEEKTEVREEEVAAEKFREPTVSSEPVVRERIQEAPQTETTEVVREESHEFVPDVRTEETKIREPAVVRTTEVPPRTETVRDERQEFVSETVRDSGPQVTERRETVQREIPRRRVVVEPPRTETRTAREVRQEPLREAVRREVEPPQRVREDRRRLVDEVVSGPTVERVPEPVVQETRTSTVGERWDAGMAERVIKIVLGVLAVLILVPLVLWGAFFLLGNARGAYNSAFRDDPAASAYATIDEFRDLQRKEREAQRRIDRELEAHRRAATRLEDTQQDLREYISPKQRLDIARDAARVGAREAEERLRRNSAQ